MRIIAILLVLPLAGCAGFFNTAGSGEFSCPGMPGVMCKTPGQVYKMTQGDMLDASVLDAKIVSTKRVNSFATTVDTNTPMPIRESAKVMRVWIAPWTDQNDDLHWPSYVYTEIQRRKWNFGNPDFKAMNPVIPYRNMSTSTVTQPSAASIKQAPQPSVALPSPSENP